MESPRQKDSPQRKIELIPGKLFDSRKIDWGIHLRVHSGGMMEGPQQKDSSQRKIELIPEKLFDSRKIVWHSPQSALWRNDGRPPAKRQLPEEN